MQQKVTYICAINYSFTQSLRRSEFTFTFSDNGTYIRLRECTLRGYQVFALSDRFQLNGKDYLYIDPDAVSWTVLVPEPSDVKKMWALETELAGLEKSHLKEDCEEFIKQMNDNGNQEGELL